jgi:eukaryotic-like serine/threonine-protein kinase
MKSIGKYEILDEIGSGVAGTTYRARDNFRNRELVVKALRPIPNLDAGAKNEYCRELLACSEVQHRHLAKILDLGEVEGQIYIATELLSGRDLSHAGSDQALTIAQRVGILAQACEGLGFAHSRGVVHGAIKPSNLFVDGSNDVTLVDFGTAKWLSLLLAAGGRPEGLRPDYFAPEQILGQPIDERTDLFSLGLVAYQLLTGAYPFRVPTSLIPREIVHSAAQPLRELNPEIPEELEQLVLRALQKNPEQRFKTAEEFAAALYGIARQLRRAPGASAPERSLSREAEMPASRSGDQQIAEVAERPMPEEAASATVAAPAEAAGSTAFTIGLGASQVNAPPKPVETPHTPIPAAVEPAPAPAEAHALPVLMPPARVPMAAPLPRPKRIVQATVLPRSLKRRIIAIAAGAVLAIYAFLNFVSHQGLHASQSANQGTPVARQPVASEAPAAPPAQTSAARAGAPSAVQTAAPPAAVASRKPDPEEEQTLRREVRTLWESGRYAEAMRLVDEMLDADPASSEARAWKKRIRAAQEAEAALK